MDDDHLPLPDDVLPADVRERLFDAHLTEALLWRELRGRPGGLRFNRQRLTGKYVHDFYCPDARLAIELGVAEADQIRDEWLARAGISTMRVSAKDILDGSRFMASEIVSHAKRLLPQSHPALAADAEAAVGEE
jgi:very-short-patch-repair endonuclease